MSITNKSRKSSIPKPVLIEIFREVPLLFDRSFVWLCWWVLDGHDPIDRSVHRGFMFNRWSIVEHNPMMGLFLEILQMNKGQKLFSMLAGFSSSEHEILTNHSIRPCGSIYPVTCHVLSKATWWPYRVPQYLTKLANPSAPANTNANHNGKCKEKLRLTTGVFYYWRLKYNKISSLVCLVLLGSESITNCLSSCDI